MSDIREDLKAFLDGELSPVRAAQVQAAIDADPALRSEVDYMRALGFEIKKLAAEPTVVGAESTLNRLKQRRPWWLTPTPYIGVGLSVIILAVIFPVFAQSKAAAKRFSADAAGSEVMASPAEEPARAPADALNGRSDPTLQEKAKMDSKGRDLGLDAESSPTANSTWRATAPLLIRTADLERRVEDVAKARSETIKLANANGGFVANDSATGSEGRLPVANMTLRVPVNRFDSVCEAIRGMGTLVSDSTNSDDVTAQVADAEARLKVMRAEEESYVTMLRAAKKVGELLEIKERLSSVRQQIESLDAQRKALRDQSAFSTINVVFTQKPKVGAPEEPQNWSGDTWSNAVNGLTAALRWLGQVAIVIFVYSPIWLPIVAIGWWLSRKSKR